MYKEKRELSSPFSITRSVDKWVNLRCSGSKGKFVCAFWILQPRFSSRLSSRVSPTSLLSTNLFRSPPSELPSHKSCLWFLLRLASLLTCKGNSGGGGENRTPVLFRFYSVFINTSFIYVSEGGEMLSLRLPPDSNSWTGWIPIYHHFSDSRYGLGILLRPTLRQLNATSLI